MTIKDAFIQYFIALTVFFLLSLWIANPGYMDAEYYTLCAQQIAEGKGLTQPVLWNYLDNPSGLPHPSFTYWMPGPSLAAVAGMIVSGSNGFRNAQLSMIILAALAAPVAGWMGYRFGKNRLSAWLAAGMAALSGFYAVYATTVDSFFLVMIGASVILFCLDWIQKKKEKEWLFWLVAGLAAGWMHLNRADGLIWLGLVIGGLFFDSLKTKHGVRQILIYAALLLAGYFGLTGFWFFRNFSMYGNPFVPNSTRALWMTSYNELFSYPPELLSFSHWKSTGWDVIFLDRIKALGNNLAAILGVQGMVFLLPFWITAITELRNDRLVRTGLGMELVILGIMSFIFPYSGRQGGFLHSSAALMPFLWGLAAAGFSLLVEWVAKIRKWEPQRAIKLFSPALIVICGLATFFIFQILVLGQDYSNRVWDESYRDSLSAKNLVDQNNIPPEKRIMINNPVGFTSFSGRESIVIPNGDPSVTRDVAEKFDVEYIILEKKIVEGLVELYKNPNDYPDFTIIDRQGDKILLKINGVN